MIVSDDVRALGACNGLWSMTEARALPFTRMGVPTQQSELQYCNIQLFSH